MLKTTLLSSSIAAALSLPTMAQQAPVPEDKKYNEVEVITVTAQKRTEKLIEVPIAMTNFSAENITQTGVQQLKDISQYIPNFTMSSGTDFSSSVSIRGVGSNSRNIGFDTRVGVYLDGVYLGQSPALNQSLLDLERIEVLRGPQGTLFGKNTVAGAVNLISAKPSDDFSASINTSFGNYGAKEVSGIVNVPLSDNLFTKVSLSKQNREGFIENIATGNSINELNDSSYRARLLYISDDEKFEASFSVDGLKGDRLSYTGEAVTDTFGISLQRPELDEYQVNMDRDPTEERDISGVSMILDWQLDNNFSLRSITANRDSDIYYVNDTDYSPIDLIVIDYRDIYQQLSKELQLISPDEGNLKYVLGLYYYDQKASTDRSVFAGPVAQHLFGITAPTVTEGTVDTLSYASFLNGSYQLSESWKLGFGFRYSIEDKEVDWRIDGSGAPLFQTATGEVVDERQDKHFSPTVNINYAFNSNVHGYAKYSSGYKSGGYNLDFVSISAFASGIEFDKETVESYEIGLKGSILDNRLSYSLAKFQTFYDDYQVNQFTDLGNGATAISIRNAAEVETKGFEAEASYSLNGFWQLTAALGLLDGEFSDFPGGATGGEDATGNTIPGISDISLSLGVQYYYPIPAIGAELLTRVDYSYRSDYYTSVDNIQSKELVSGDSVQSGWVDDTSIVNARLGLLSDEGTWDVALWVKNLTDKSYLTGTGRDFLGTIRHFRGAPRTYGVELNYNF